VGWGLVEHHLIETRYGGTAGDSAPLVIVPAVISLMGRWNWWLPGPPARLLRVEPSPPPRAAGSEAEA
jgi:hypothetical protein